MKHKNYNTCIQQRIQLLNNGFIPLPLDGKRPTYKGWTRQHVDEAWLNSFKRKTKYANTGLRCDDLIAFDIDVLDVDLAFAIEEMIESMAGQTDLARYGKFPKRLLLYRAAGSAAKSARTGKYGGHMVEMLATRGRQFVACGIHPETGEAYQWAADDLTPLEIPFAKLPVLTPAAAIDILDKVDAYLAETGLPRETAPRRLGVEHADSYDLADDTDCQLVDGTETTWGELRLNLDTVGVMGNLRRETGEFGDSNGVHFYLSDIDGAPCAYDFARDTLHREAPALEKLADALPVDHADDHFEPDHLGEMLDQWVLLGDDNARLIDHPFHSYKLSALKNFMAHKTVLQPMKKGPDKPIPVVDVWKAHPKTKRAHHDALRPDHPDDILISEGRQIIFNTYRRQVLPAGGGELDTFFEFMDHLLPNDEAYHLVMGWLAYKYVHPGERMHGLLLVTPSQGTGRGTLAKILGCLFGQEYVRQSDLHDLVSNSGQAMYNDDLADSLIVYVPEALEYKTNVSQYYQRRNAYENLKQIIDPIATTVKIKRKYGKNTMERTFASVLISSNHIDALAIDENDRRLIVLENTDVPLTAAPKQIRQRIHDWMKTPANVGALARYLVEYAKTSTYDPFGDAPMTEIKERMIDAGRSEVDHLYELFVIDAEGDLCTQNQVVRYMEQQAREQNMDIPEGKNLQNAVSHLLKKRASRIDPHNPNRQIRFNKVRVRPWIIRNVNQWLMVTDNKCVTSELTKNGPVTLSLVPTLPTRNDNGANQDENGAD